MSKILVTRSSMPDMEEYIEEIRSLWDTHWLTNMGEKHERLREELASYLDVQKLDLLTNGHMALELGLQALELPIGGEVITTPFTFVSTTHAIVRNGLVPVFCDINPEDFTIDVTKIESLITDKTCAILPVHVYGNLCDTEAIDDIAKRHGLKVIYDAAHAFGVTKNGAGAGSFGDISILSFHATKVYNTIEGGAVCYRDEDFGRRLYNLKNFGIQDEETIEAVGANAKMNEFCAAMGLCNLKHIDTEIAKRKQVADIYRSRLSDVPGIQLSPIRDGVSSNYAYFPIVIHPEAFGCGRDDVFAKLAENDIGARKYFYPITNDIDCYRGRFDSGSTPVALDISRKVLTIPIYADLPLDDARRIADIIVSCKR